MTRRDQGSRFKRILSNTSSNSGDNPTSQKHSDFFNSKKSTKLKTAALEAVHSREDTNYSLYPDHEPLLNPMQPSSPADISDSGRSTRGLAALHDPTCGHLTPFRQDSSRGIMSVTDIELTVGDDDFRNRSFIPPGSPMDESSSCTGSTKSGNQCCPVPRCSNASCNESNCLWHLCVLKLPHLVIWEDKIITIELQQNGEKSFGFNHKLKEHVGKEETYLLVSQVDENSNAAKSGLKMGDLILSANNVAMQTQKKLSEIKWKNQPTLRLQIQHPQKISRRADYQVEQLKASIGRMIEVPDHCRRLAQPLTPPSTSPTDTGLSPTRENIQLFTLPMSKVCDQYLPLVRMFVCGNASCEFIRCLSNGFINTFQDDRPLCFRVAMKKSVDGQIFLGNSESFSYLFDNFSETCINIELISVPNDLFFHHLCSWMFTVDSFFIITFDTRRLSQFSEVEMARLCNLAHTIQTGMFGCNTNLRVYGITQADDSIPPEEVRTLFYTSLGKSLPEPKVIPLTVGTSCQEMNEARLDIFTTLMKICERQKVTHLTAFALDLLVLNPELNINRNDLVKAIENSNLETKQVGFESVSRMVEDLRSTGNLLLLGSLGAAGNLDNRNDFVVPYVLFEHLCRLAQCREIASVIQETWLTLCSSGIVTRMEFLDVLRECSPEPEKLFICMESLRLVFPIQVQAQDSGFGETSEILFPYFLHDVPFYATNLSDNYEEFFTVEFSTDVQASYFFSLLSELSQSDSCQSLKMKAQFVGHVITQEEDICLYFLKTSKQLQVFRKRMDQPLNCMGKQSAFQQIQQSLHRLIPNYVKMNVILYPERVSRAKPEDVAIADEVGFQSGGSTDTRPEENMLNALPSSADGAAELPNLPNYLSYVPIPPKLFAENDGGAAAMPPAVPRPEPGVDERIVQRILNTNIQELRYIHRALNAIYQCLSMHDLLQELAGDCGLSLSEWMLYEVWIRQQSNRLPAQAFLELYFREKCVTLGDFMKVLLRMEARGRHILADKIQNLWEDALNGNVN